MSYPLLIGLCGRARHGKDSTALRMQQYFDEYHVRTFSSSISQIVFDEAQVRGYIRNDIMTRANCGADELNTLVRLGHEGRAISENYWLDKLEARILKSGAEVAFIPGVRFPNEVDWVRRDHKGYIVKVVRYNKDGSLFISPDRDPNDPMETVLNRIVPDFEICALYGQQMWLEFQGKSLAKYIFNETFRGKHVA